MARENRKMKILWAVDAFDDLRTLQDKVVHAATTFGEHVELEIDPVYVLSPDQLGVALEFSDPWTNKYGPAAKEELKHKLKDLPLPGLREPRVLTQLRSSLRAAVETLADHAAKGGYDLILTGSHGRKGLERLALGSFAEELLLRSRTPVFVIGSHAEDWEARWSHKPLHVLIPSDLNHPDSPFFREVFRAVDNLEAKATLLNVIPRPIEPVFQSGVYLLSGGWVPVSQYLGRERTRQTEAAAKVLKLAREAGIPVESVVDDAGASVVGAILRHAQEGGVSFIAMAAESGPTASTLLGSITRQVVRSAPCPVWVFRAK